MKCCYCKRRFSLKSQNRYLSAEPTSFANAFNGGGAVYDTFDCPHCGCQHRITERYQYFLGDSQTDTEEESE